MQQEDNTGCAGLKNSGLSFTSIPRYNPSSLFFSLNKKVDNVISVKKSNIWIAATIQISDLEADSGT